ncbi:MAG: threonylcarbamoyl-AMP synthase [Desulfobulbus propionicus]|nr:MAG: threonylcarbamoyl-AMP synthase [Desulfobulbus propionicus]PIE63591.1 MAG: threonylcarbamoyl-AMP synthase [Desulfobacterales bacterium]
MSTADRIDKHIHRAVDVLQSGGLIAFPTETYYGLGVDPFNRGALKKLFEVKQRAAHLPILVLIESITQAGQLARLPLPPLFLQLAQQFWPGPLTLICRAAGHLPRELTGYTDSIGMRHSSNTIAQQLVKNFGRPVTATSANVSGHIPACNPSQVRAIFSEKIDYVVDGGETPGGKGSTLVRCEADSIECIRKGVLNYSMVLDMLDNE